MGNTYENLPYSLEDTYILPFGTFHFYENFIVAQVKDGISFNVEMVDTILELVNNHYGTKQNVGYISHRIHSYNVDKKVWIKMLKEGSRFSSYATVHAEKEPLWNRFLKFKKKNIEHSKFNSILDAASWITSLNILIKNKIIEKKTFVTPVHNVTHLL